jgi:hypothetical protein
MEFRSSNSVVALALFLASGACALFAPEARAGEPLEFSRPAVPLAVPQPVVETKEPKKLIGSGDPTINIMGVDMGPPEQFSFTKSKSKEKYEWDSESRLADPLLGKDAILGKDEERRDADDWLTALPETSRLTNGRNSNMPRGWDGRASDGSLRRTNDAGFRPGQNGSIFGSQIGFDAEMTRDGNRDLRNGDPNSQDGSRDGRDGDQIARDSGQIGREGNRDMRNGDPIMWDADRYARDASNSKDSLTLTAKSSSDTSATDRFNAAQFTPFMDAYGNFGVGVHEIQMTAPEPPTDSSRNAPVFSDSGNFAPLADGQNRQGDEQAFDGFGVRAWESPSASQPPPRSIFNPGQTSPSQVVAPSRPVNLAWPKRPGDPF